MSDQNIFLKVKRAEILFSSSEKSNRTTIRLIVVPNTRPIQFPDNDIMYVDGKDKNGDDSDKSVLVYISNVNFDEGKVGYLTYWEYRGIDFSISFSNEQINHLVNLIASGKTIEYVDIGVKNIVDSESISQMLEIKKDQYEVNYCEFVIKT